MRKRRGPSKSEEEDEIDDAHGHGARRKHDEIAERDAMAVSANAPGDHDEHAEPEHGERDQVEYFVCEYPATAWIEVVEAE